MSGRGRVLNIEIVRAFWEITTRLAWELVFRVAGLSVSLKMNELSEPLLAQRTRVRKFAAVLARVRFEVARTAEALTALGAFVRSLAGVNELMLFEMGQLREGLSALFAGEGSLASVNADVHLEIGQLREDLLAVTAVVNGLPVLLVQLVGKRTMTTQFLLCVSFPCWRIVLLFVIVVLQFEPSAGFLFVLRAGHLVHVRHVLLVFFRWLFKR